MQLPTLAVAGAPADMGRDHGVAHAEPIRCFAAERIGRAGQAEWVGAVRPEADVLALAEECLAAHERYAPELVAELRAMAGACGLSPAQVLVVSGFTDFVDTAFAAFGGSGTASPAADQCTAMLVPGACTAAGRALFAQTWDMHASATEHVFMLRGSPADAPGFTVFTSRGCIGMIGMNTAGITIGINNLTGADGRIGVTWNFVVRAVLAETDYEAAATRLCEAPLAGAHNYLLLAPDGRGMNVEATATRREITVLGDRPLAHTNHCLAAAIRAVERPRPAAAQRHSEQRLARARAMLGAPRPIDVARLAAITRDTGAICYPPGPDTGMATCGAVIAEPASRRLWALRGLPSASRYQLFKPG